MFVQGPGPAAGRIVRKGTGAGITAGRFSLPSAAGDAVEEVRGQGAVSPLGSLDTLLAVQGLPDRLEERRRAAQRGHSLLDRLAELNLALLEGGSSASVLPVLRNELASRQASSGDHGLDALLRSIELRVEVELAKGPG